MPGFLTREYAKIPMWGWIMGGVAGLVIFSSIKSKSAATGNAAGTKSTSQPTGNNGDGTPPNIFFLPQGPYQGPNPTNITVTLNPRARDKPMPLPTPQPQPEQKWPTIPANRSNPTPAPTPQPRDTVTVEKWPGRSQGGLAQWNTTLWGIANHFGTTVAKLAADNNISNPNLIYPGQRIVVW
jgi:hypothetical protein